MRLGRFTITALSANPDLDVRTAPDCRFSLRNLAIEHNRDNKHHELLIHRSIFFVNIFICLINRFMESNPNE